MFIKNSHDLVQYIALQNMLSLAENLISQVLARWTIKYSAYQS